MPYITELTAGFGGLDQTVSCEGLDFGLTQLRKAESQIGSRHMAGVCRQYAANGADQGAKRLIKGQRQPRAEP